MRLPIHPALGLLVLSLTTASVTSQDEPFELPDTIVVTASRTPVTYTEVSRTITVLGPEEIAAAPAGTILDLLAYVPGLEVRRLGTNGVRADIGIRGGTFEQALILIDGTKITDPQTGHHNLDLPFDLGQVERIEIVRGSGSKLYGPNAMSGVVNIITRRPAGHRLLLESVIGEHRLSEERLSATATTGRIGHRVSIARRGTSGFRDNTESDLVNLSYRASLRTNRGPINASVSYADREFGAHRLYSDTYPDEWESTSTLFASATARLLIAGGIISPKLFWRRHEDDFVLDRHRPDWVRNQHTCNQYGLELQTTIESPWGELVLGCEIAKDEMESRGLGDHRRSRGGLFAEQRFTLTERFTVVPGLSTYWHKDYGWTGWPGLDIGYQPAEGTKLYLTANRSYRVPNFTELFYQSPANRGNPELRPEEAASYELGIRLTRAQIEMSASLFVRRGTDLIDWAPSPEDPTVWQVQNVFRVTTSGLEAGVSVDRPLTSPALTLQQFGIHYSYLDSKHHDGLYESKHLLGHSRHQLTFHLDCLWFEKLRLSSVARYARRLLGGEYLVVDTRLNCRCGRASIFAEVSNLFSEEYSEIRDIPMPGRWLKAGISLDLLSPENR